MYHARASHRPTAHPPARTSNDQVWATDGLQRGVMRGFSVTVLREVPAYAGFYAGFETGKQLFRRRLYPNAAASGTPLSQQQLPVWALMCSGSLGGICNWLACYPLGEKEASERTVRRIRRSLFAHTPVHPFTSTLALRSTSHPPPRNLDANDLCPHRPVDARPPT